MALTLKVGTKGTVRFEWADDDAETVVTLSTTDNEETLVRKMKRIITLTEIPPVTRSVAAALGTQERHPAAAVVPGNGWAAYRAPEVPDRLKDEVELIKAEEE